MLCPRCRIRLSSGTLDRLAAMAEAGPYRTAPAAQPSGDVDEDQIRVNRCNRCAGLFFPGGELAKALRSMAIVEVPDMPREPPDTNALCHCPSCSQLMATLLSRAARVVYDRCDGCRGVWLDAGEVGRFANPLVALSAVMPGDAVRLERQPSGALGPAAPDADDADPSSIEILSGHSGPVLLRLLIEEPDGTKQACHARLGVLKIGKLPSAAAIRLEGDDVSRMHAVIEAEDVDAVTLVDLGSSTGTRVNDATVSKVRLAVGDRIGVGDYVITVRAIEDASSSAS